MGLISYLLPLYVDVVECLLEKSVDFNGLGCCTHSIILQLIRLMDEAHLYVDEISTCG